MVQEYIISKKELMNSSIIVNDGRNIPNAIFTHLPPRIVEHSRRVQDICIFLASYIPEDLLPKDLDSEDYIVAMSRGAQYHEIGIYAARNDIHHRPLAGSSLLKKYWPIETCAMNRIVFETVKYHKQKYIFNDEIPLHAAICAIACAVDMATMTNGKYSEKKFKRITDYICDNSDKTFHPEAVKCFKAARDEVFSHMSGIVVGSEKGMQDMNIIILN